MVPVLYLACCYYNKLASCSAHSTYNRYMGTYTNLLGFPSIALTFEYSWNKKDHFCLFHHLLLSAPPYSPLHILHFYRLSLYAILNIHIHHQHFHHFQADIFFFKRCPIRKYNRMYQIILFWYHQKVIWQQMAGSTTSITMLYILGSNGDLDFWSPCIFHDYQLRRLLTFFIVETRLGVPGHTDRGLSCMSQTK